MKLLQVGETGVNIDNIESIFIRDEYVNEDGYILVRIYFKHKLDAEEWTPDIITEKQYNKLKKDIKKYYLK